MSLLKLLKPNIKKSQKANWHRITKIILNIKKSSEMSKACQSPPHKAPSYDFWLLFFPQKISSSSSLIISLNFFSHAHILLTFFLSSHSRFCVGDKYYLCDNKILCPYDYEERLVFAGLADNPTNLAHMKRQLNNLQVILFPCFCQIQFLCFGCKHWWVGEKKYKKCKVWHKSRLM